MTVTETGTSADRQQVSEVNALQFIPLMELISIFIHSEAELESSGSEGQQIFFQQ